MHAGELDPAAVTYTLPDKVKWESIPGFPGAERAVMVGDPSKPGFYAVMIKWLPGNHFSHPHFHPHDRFITVLKGTWWVGSGTRFDPDRYGPDARRGHSSRITASKFTFDGAKARKRSS
jgi:hypothetical protein